MKLAFELLRAFLFGFWTTIRSVWPVLNTYFDINHRIIMAVILAILAAIGVPVVIRNIVKHF